MRALHDVGRGFYWVVLRGYFGRDLCVMVCWVGCGHVAKLCYLEYQSINLIYKEFYILYNASEIITEINRN